MRKLTMVLVLALGVVGCGGGGSPPIGARQAPKAALVRQCPPGGGQMGCATARLPQLQRFKTTIAGPKIPDVSSYQGYPSWGVTKPYVAGVIVKAGEYVRDPSFVYNATHLNAQHMWWAPYWFVRGYGCTRQAALFVAIVSPYHPPGPYVLDMEVPEARGQAPCMAAEIKRLTGWRTVVEYTSIGTDPGGGHADVLWDANWGLGYNAIWTPVVAHQYTGDGYGPYPHSLPGISESRLDISVDLGITHYRLGPPPPPPDPYAIFPKVAFPFAFGRVSEHDVVATWFKLRCRNPVRRSACRKAHYDAELLRDREWFVAHHSADLKHAIRHPRWGVFHLGERFQVFTHIVKGR